ncbi:hypothetical protein CcaCcLH18_10737 [Colletotrichum camelliae]|nr:hypothetical protein CcaCcLH18_10737 [Colletotrichum camelliae]
MFARSRNMEITEPGSIYQDNHLVNRGSSVPSLQGKLLGKGHSSSIPESVIPSTGMTRLASNINEASIS